jgi:uncharacterized Ntn-hydrolase superfamily protein
LTFSIIAVDGPSGEVGGAVASRLIGVGSLVTHARANVGVIASLTCRKEPVRFRYGREGLSLLSQNYSVEEVLERLLEVDSKREEMQISVIDMGGRVAAFTGKKMPEWCGHIVGNGFSIQGNTLANQNVARSMLEAYQTTGANELAIRLATALMAGDDAGGDRRGKQAAGLLVVRDYGGVLGFSDEVVNLRVDDHTEPVRELLRLLPLYTDTFRSRRFR